MISIRLDGGATSSQKATWHSGAPEKELHRVHNRVVCGTWDGEVGRLVTRAKHAASPYKVVPRLREMSPVDSAAQLSGRGSSGPGLVWLSLPPPSAPAASGQPGHLANLPAPRGWATLL